MFHLLLVLVRHRQMQIRIAAASIQNPNGKVNNIRYFSNGRP